MRLVSLCTYTVESLEFLDTPVHKQVDVVLITSVRQITVLPM